MAATELLVVGLTALSEDSVGLGALADETPLVGQEGQPMLMP